MAVPITANLEKKTMLIVVTVKNNHNCVPVLLIEQSPAICKLQRTILQTCTQIIRQIIYIYQKLEHLPKNRPYQKSKSSNIQ
jgi:hypothetical protein